MRRFTGILALLLLLAAMPVLAQDDPAETTDPTVSVTGPLTFTHPEGWRAIEAQGGRSVLAKFPDGALDGEIGDTEPLLVAQIEMLGLPRIANLNPNEENAFNILGALLLAQGMDATITEDIVDIEGENRTFARVDISTETAQTFVYTVILSDTTFAIVIAASTDDILLEEEPNIVSILDTVELDVQAPIPDEALGRYDGIETSMTERGFPQIGSADAPATVIEISSFDCPACRSFHDNVLIPELLPRIEAGEVRFVYLPIFGTGSIPNGDSAIRASVCVGNDFWTYHDAVFNWQDFGGYAFIYERLLDAAVELGVDAEAFNACYISDETTQVLQNGLDRAREFLGDGISTPTIIVNGNRVSATPQAINDAVDSILRSQ